MIIIWMFERNKLRLHLHLSRNFVRDQDYPVCELTYCVRPNFVHIESTSVTLVSCANCKCVLCQCFLWILVEVTLHLKNWGSIYKFSYDNAEVTIDLR